MSKPQGLTFKSHTNEKEDSCLQRKAAMAYLRSSADSIRSSPADSIVCCQELVDPGITNPKSKNHSAEEGGVRGIELLEL